MDRVRFTYLERTLVAAAPVVFLICVGLWVANESLYFEGGRAILFTMAGAVLVGGYSILANDRLAALPRTLLALAYIGVMTVAALYTAVATGLVLV